MKEIGEDIQGIYYLEEKDLSALSNLGLKTTHLRGHEWPETLQKIKQEGVFPELTLNITGLFYQHRTEDAACHGLIYRVSDNKICQIPIIEPRGHKRVHSHILATKDDYHRMEIPAASMVQIKGIYVVVNGIVNYYNKPSGNHFIDLKFNKLSDALAERGM